MVLTLQRAHAATPGTQGKSARALPDRAASARAHGKHRRNSMCAGANMQTNAAARGAPRLGTFQKQTLMTALLTGRTLPARGFTADLRTLLPAHKESGVKNEQMSSDAL